jgi:hypothetical protein
MAVFTERIRSDIISVHLAPSLTMLAFATIAVIANFAAQDRSSMVYMYCTSSESCNARTDIATNYSKSLTNVIIGSHLCRTTEFKAGKGDEWCDYSSNYSSNVQSLRNAGIQVYLNAAGAHNFKTLPFVTTEEGVTRMVSLAQELGASGWAFDLEAKGIALETYKAFFEKVGHAFRPKGLKISYTSGKHFANSMNYTALLPLVDSVFDMSCYSGCQKAFPSQFKNVPAGMRQKYIPGASTNQWDEESAMANLEMFDSASGLQTIGLFAITENISSWWFDTYLSNWTSA